LDIGFEWQRNNQKISSKEGQWAKINQYGWKESSQYVLFGAHGTRKIDKKVKGICVEKRPKTSRVFKITNRAFYQKKSGFYSLKTAKA